MRGILSIGIKLDTVIKDSELERIVLENVVGCSKLVGNLFKVVFWHENLTGEDCKEFIKRNKEILFKVNSEITKDCNDIWFFIDSKNNNKYGRYRYDGDILQGISQYLNIINHMKKRDKE